MSIQQPIVQQWTHGEHANSEDTAHSESRLFEESARRHRQQQRILDKMSILDRSQCHTSSKLHGSPNMSIEDNDVSRLSDFCAGLVDELQQLQGTLRGVQSQQKLLQEGIMGMYVAGNLTESPQHLRKSWSQTPIPQSSQSAPDFAQVLRGGLDSPSLRVALPKGRFVSAAPSRSKTCPPSSEPMIASFEKEVACMERRHRCFTEPTVPVLLGRKFHRSASSQPSSAQSLHCMEGDDTRNDADRRQSVASISSNHVSFAPTDETFMPESSGPFYQRESLPTIVSMGDNTSELTHDDICADAAAGPNNASTSKQKSQAEYKIEVKRRSSLDSGLSHEDVAQLSAGTSRLSSMLWPSRSISLFGLQKEVAEAHAVLPVASNEDTELSVRYVGLLCFQRLRAKLSWCKKGSAFRWMAVSLKLFGTMLASRPYAEASENITIVRIRHYASLGYMTGWHLGIWFVLLMHAMQALLKHRHTISYGLTVQVLLLLAAAAAHVANIRFFASRTFADLCHYATRSVFVQSWSVASKRVAVALIVPLLVLGVVSKLLHGWSLIAVAHSAAWIPLLIQVHISSTTLYFCSLGLDAFALELLNTTILEGLVARFDKLHAAMRRSAYAVQLGLTIFAASLSAVLFATFYHLMFTGFGGPSGTDSITVPWAKSQDGAALVSVIVLFLLGLHLLHQIAMVNAKCKRLPALIQSLNFGAEIDHDKWCVAAHIASLEAGFFVHNVPVTRLSVLKFGYFSLAATSFLLTRLVFAAH